MLLESLDNTEQTAVNMISVDFAKMSISQNKTVIDVRAKKSETFYKTVENNAKKVGLSINLKKTQMMCVSPALYSDVNTFIKINGVIIKSQEELKILGFIFGRNPTIKNHIDMIKLKFRRRVWILRHLKKADIPESDLIKLYLSLVLPVLDYTCVVYHSMLTITQSCLLYTSPSPRDLSTSRMPSSA